MAWRIANTRPVSVGKNTKGVKSQTYLNWIKTLPCVITGRRPVDPAHVNFKADQWGAPGRGKSGKASDRFALPLHRSEHDIQHGMNEEAYWISRGIDPHALGCALYGHFCERKGKADDQALEIIRLHRSGGDEQKRANRGTSKDSP